MKLARSLRDKNNRVSVIFVTACEDYLSNRYSVLPILFPLKPVRREAPESAIHSDLKLNYIPKKIVVHIGNKPVPLSLSDIRYVESCNLSIVIHQSTGNSSFFRFRFLKSTFRWGNLHTSATVISYLVNLEDVREIVQTETSLQRGETLPMGSRYNKAFRSAFVRCINQ